MRRKVVWDISLCQKQLRLKKSARLQHCIRADSQSTALLFIVICTMWWRMYFSILVAYLTEPFSFSLHILRVKKKGKEGDPWRPVSDSWSRVGQWLGRCQPPDSLSLSPWSVESGRRFLSPLPSPQHTYIHTNVHTRVHTQYDIRRTRAWNICYRLAADYLAGVQRRRKRDPRWDLKVSRLM